MRLACNIGYFINFYEAISSKKKAHKVRYRFSLCLSTPAFMGSGFRKELDCKINQDRKFH